MQKFFDPIYPSFGEAIELIKKPNVISVAFAPYYKLGKDWNSPGCWLQRKNISIGKILNHGIQVEQELFKQEIHDLVRRGVITNTFVI